MKKKKDFLKRISSGSRSWKYGSTYKTTVVVKCGEELVENDLRNILHLRAHPNGLGSNVHGEDFGSPNPSRSSP